MKKRLMSLLFVFVLLLTCLPMQVKADQEYTYYYTKISAKKDGFYTISNKAKSKVYKSAFYLVKGKKKGKYVTDMNISKGKSDTVYLAKGTYYLVQEIGEYDTVKRNKSFKVKYKAKALTTSVGKSVKVNGMLSKGAYVKIVAKKTGLYNFKPSGSTYSYKVQLMNSKFKALSVAYTQKDWKDYTAAFAMTKGKTYYLKITSSKAESITFMVNYEGTSKYPFNTATKKTKAYDLSGTYKAVGVDGKDTVWYKYTNNSQTESHPDITITFGHFMGYDVETKHAVSAILYDDAGRSIGPVVNGNGLEWRDGTLTVPAGKTVYIKIIVAAGHQGMLCCDEW